MSESGQFYRIYGTNPTDFKSLLKRALPNYKLGRSKKGTICLCPSESEIAANKKRELEEMGFDPGYTEEDYQLMLYLEEEEHPNLLLFRTWMSNANFEMEQVLSAAGLTFVSYCYHTGAGWDELKLYSRGDERYIENIADEFISYGEVSSELKWGPGTLQQTALTELSVELGDAQVLIQGWQECVKEGEPLHTALPFE